MKSLRILITGANGFVGKSLTLLMQNKGYEVIPIGFGGSCDAMAAAPDLTDFQTALTCVEVHRPSVIIHLAGLKDVFLCEKDKALSHKLNVIMTENITAICCRLSCKLIFISSDYVFDGNNGSYAETSISNPSTQYGRDKAKAEAHIRKELENYAIVRTSGLFGMKEDFPSVVIRHLRAKMPFAAYHNLINTPTFVDDFAVMLWRIIDNQMTGLFHCSGPESLSRYEFGERIACAFFGDASLVQATALDFARDIRPPSLPIDSTRTYQRLNYFPDTIDNTLLKHKHLWM